MRAYIVEYQLYDISSQRVELLFSHISQVGYNSLEDAQEFIERKPGAPVAVTPMEYKSSDGKERYIIHDVLIREAGAGGAPAAALRTHPRGGLRHGQQVGD